MTARDVPAPEVRATASHAWPSPTVALHWLSAALLVGLVGAGFLLSELPRDSGTRLLLARAHTLGGLTLVVLTTLRLITRLRGLSPSPLPLPDLHRLGVRLVHGLLYAVLFGIGASGVATALTTSWPSYIRGEASLAPVLAEVASRQAHELGVFALGALVLLHVGGVLVQQARGGDVLRRMLPSFKRDRGNDGPESGARS